MEPWEERGAADIVVTHSGGACGPMADRAGGSVCIKHKRHTPPSLGFNSSPPHYHPAPATEN